MPGLAGVDLNLLVAFDTLMSERSVTKAAERLSVGQSAMSATLGRLRRLFGDPLLVRQGRHLVTTPLADSLIEPVRDALSTIERTLWPTRPGFDPATDARTFSVIASDYVTLVFLRPLPARLATEAPNVRLHLHPVTADFRDKLRRNLADLLIMPREILGPSHNLTSSPQFSDRYLCGPRQPRHRRHSRTPGRYTYDNIGNDLVRFIASVIARPVVVAGNSSGGVLSAWLSAFAMPGQIRGALLEDPPLFSGEPAPLYGPSQRQSSGPVLELFRDFLGDQWRIGDWAGFLAAAKNSPSPLARMMGSFDEVPQAFKEYDPEWSRAFLGNHGRRLPH